MQDYSIVIFSYDANGKVIATKTFNGVPAGNETDLSSQRGFIGKYAALTNAITTKANLVITKEVDLS